ncbi:MAG: hypothetical protein COU33_02140, partial [Candidatus Magasanikbacteria bacterium CG10_big_fil_rev_8_21_14_0_10_43_6]
SSAWTAALTFSLITSGGYAESTEGKYPWTYVNQTAARQACEQHPTGRKHLCTSNEWMAASNINGQTYNLPATLSNCTIDESTDCDWTDAPGSGDACLTGSKTNCKSAELVYDMTGNLWEWANETITVTIPPAGGNSWYYINTTSQQYTVNNSAADNGRYGKDGTYFGTAGVRGVLRGGGWHYGISAGPFCAYLGNAPSATGYPVGFRCCAAPN